MSGLLNTPKYKFKLKWNVPLSDVQFVEYGAGVSVAAGKYGTITTYSDQGINSIATYIHLKQRYPSWVEKP